MFSDKGNVTVVVFHLQTVFNAKYMCMLMICHHTQVHLPHTSSSLLTIILKAKDSIRTLALLSLQSEKVYPALKPSSVTLGVFVIPPYNLAHP
jgi:hypothetical protein